MKNLLHLTRHVARNTEQFNEEITVGVIRALSLLINLIQIYYHF